jgi:hypothetical protein
MTKINGTNLAILGSISAETSSLIIVLEVSHQKNKFIKYLNPEFECFWPLLNVQR